MKLRLLVGNPLAAFASVHYFSQGSNLSLQIPRTRLLLSTSSRKTFLRSSCTMSSSVESPWHAAYPAPRNTTPQGVSPGELLSILREGKERIVLVDLRRNDHEGGTILGSINLPAQSLHPSIPSLYNLFAASNVKKVIWYCASSKGRGNRAAGWFSDYLEDQNDNNMESIVLAGGIKGWVAAGKDHTDYMVEFNATKW